MDQMTKNSKVTQLNANVDLRVGMMKVWPKQRALPVQLLVSRALREELGIQWNFFQRT